MQGDARGLDASSTGGQAKLFVEEFANPHSWLLTADDLHEQAVAIYAGRASSSIITKVGAGNTVLQQSRGIDRSVFLLGGFALENAIKAFLVYENPQWVSNGRLSRNLKSHSLTALQSKSELVPYKKRHISTLKAFEGGLDSWFRYPCALTVEETNPEGHQAHGTTQPRVAGPTRLLRALDRQR